MRLNGADAGPGWCIWHCESMVEICNCAFVDDVTNEFATVEQLYPAGSIMITYSAKKISIYQFLKLVLINPIPGDDKYTKRPPNHAISPPKPAGE